MRYRLCYYCRQPIVAADFNSHRRRCYDAQSERREHTGSGEWKATRAAVRKRDGGVCRALRLAAMLPPAIASSLRSLPCDGLLHVCHLAGDWRDSDPSGLLLMCERHHKAYDAAMARQS